MNNLMMQPGECINQPEDIPTLKIFSGIENMMNICTCLNWGASLYKRPPPSYSHKLGSVTCLQLTLSVRPSVMIVILSLLGALRFICATQKNFDGNCTGVIMKS